MFKCLSHKFSNIGVPGVALLAAVRFSFLCWHLTFAHMLFQYCVMKLLHAVFYYVNMSVRYSSGRVVKYHCES